MYIVDHLLDLPESLDSFFDTEKTALTILNKKIIMIIVRTKCHQQWASVLLLLILSKPKALPITIYWLRFLLLHLDRNCIIVDRYKVYKCCSREASHPL